MKYVITLVLFCAALTVAAIIGLAVSRAEAGGSAPPFWLHPPQYIDRSLCENREHSPRYCFPPPARPRMQLDQESPLVVLLGEPSSVYNSITAAATSKSISSVGVNHAQGGITVEGDTNVSMVEHIFNSSDTYNYFDISKYCKCDGGTVTVPPVAPIPLLSSGWLMLGLLLPCLGGAAIVRARATA